MGVEYCGKVYRIMKNVKLMIAKVITKKPFKETTEVKQKLILHNNYEDKTDSSLRFLNVEL